MHLAKSKSTSINLQDAGVFIVTSCLFAAVQEERQRVKEKGEGEVESTSSANVDMPVERILEAELAVEPKIETYIDTQVSFIARITINFADLYCCNSNICIVTLALLIHKIE